VQPSTDNAMTAISYTAARENLAAIMNKVCEDHAPIIITRNRDQAVVMMSLADYESLEETAYLLRSPKNAKRVMSAITQLNAGKGGDREA
jgi:antitoxin YefM